MSSYSSSYTYTVTDVKKVFDRVRSDFHMAAQSTGLWTVSFVDAVVDDLTRYAQYEFLELVALYLRSPAKAIRAATYSVMSGNALAASERPGNMLWPKEPNAKLTVTVRMSKAWYDVSREKQIEFERGLHLDWSSISTEDLNFPTLSSALDRSYTSNGFGVEKSVFK